VGKVFVITAPAHVPFSGVREEFGGDCAGLFNSSFSDFARCRSFDSTGES
jgi:hypothetical protein